MLLSSADETRAKAMIGESYTALNNVNARIGVGDDDTAANKTQTDLEASANKVYLTMDATYPTRSGPDLTFRVTAADGVGEFAWKEFLICDGSPGTAWARFVQVLNGGVAKAAGEVWALEITATVGRNDAAN
jgi:hypothetical protein